MRLSGYVKKQSFLAMLLTTLILLLLQALFSYIGEIEDFSDSYRWSDAALYVFWQLPELFIEILPVAALVGAVTGLGALSQQSELTVMRASGVSSVRIVGWALQVAFFWAVAAVLVNQYWLPDASFKAQMIKDPKQAKSSMELSGVWLYENDRMSYISRAGAGGEILGYQSWQFDESGDLLEALSSERGHFDTSLKTWVLAEPKRTQFLSQAPLTAATSAQSVQPIELSVRPDNLYLVTRTPEHLSLTDLLKYVQIADAKGENAFEHRLSFWQKLLSPLSVLSLVLLASAFVFGESRSQSMGFRLVIALLTGLGFSYFQRLFSYLSLATQSAPQLYVLLPILFSAGLGWYLLRRRH